MKTLHKAATFDLTARPPVLTISEFAKGDDGSLVHIVDDKIRAIVPPEGWAQYAQDWPEAQKALDAMQSQFDTERAVREMIAVSQSALPVGGEIITPTAETPTE